MTKKEALEKLMAEKPCSIDQIILLYRALKWYDVQEFHNLNPYYKCDKYHFYANEYVLYVITTYQPIEKKQPYGWHYSDEFIMLNYK